MRKNLQSSMQQLYREFARLLDDGSALFGQELFSMPANISIESLPQFHTCCQLMFAMMSDLAVSLADDDTDMPAEIYLRFDDFVNYLEMEDHCLSNADFNQYSMLVAKHCQQRLKGYMRIESHSRACPDFTVLFPETNLADGSNHDVSAVEDAAASSSTSLFSPPPSPIAGAAASTRFDPSSGGTRVFSRSSSPIGAASANGGGGSISLFSSPAVSLAVDGFDLSGLGAILTAAIYEIRDLCPTTSTALVVSAALKERHRVSGAASTNYHSDYGSAWSYISHLELLLRTLFCRSNFIKLQKMLWSECSTCSELDLEPGYMELGSLNIIDVLLYVFLTDAKYEPIRTWLFRPYEGINNSDNTGLLALSQFTEDAEVAAALQKILVKVILEAQFADDAIAACTEYGTNCIDRRAYGFIRLQILAQTPAKPKQLWNLEEIFNHHRTQSILDAITKETDAVLATISPNSHFYQEKLQIALLIYTRMNGISGIVTKNLISHKLYSLLGWASSLSCRTKMVDGFVERFMLSCPTHEDIQALRGAAAELFIRIDQVIANACRYDAILKHLFSSLADYQVLADLISRRDQLVESLPLMSTFEDYYAAMLKDLREVFKQSNSATVPAGRAAEDSEALGSTHFVAQVHSRRDADEFCDDCFRLCNNLSRDISASNGVRIFFNSRVISDGNGLPNFVNDTDSSNPVNCQMQ